MTSHHNSLLDGFYEKRRLGLLSSGTYHWHPEETLTCPNCESDHLHHYGFTDYDRDNDDETESIIDCGTVMIDNTVKKILGHSRTHVKRNLAQRGGLQVFSAPTSDRNPSARRHGIAIKFWCEECPNISLLCIAQHKGSSLISWRTIGPVSEDAQ